MNTRKTIPVATRQAVLLEAGYRCGNPVCRHVLTLELHHIDWVKEGGSNDADNLIALCPNCHSLHTAGHIPAGAIKVWKGVLFSLTNSNRASADVLLSLYDDEARILAAEDPSKVAGRFRFTGDSLGFLSGLLGAQLVDISRRMSGAWAGTGPSFEVSLTARGKSLVEAWRSGDEGMLRAALGYGSTGTPGVDTTGTPSP